MNNNKIKNRPASKSRPASRKRKTTVKRPVPGLKVNISSPPSVALSDCAVAYASALVNPFTGPLACVPISPTVLTYKFRAWSKGEFSTGSTAAFSGFITADPYCAFVNDVACVHYSGANYNSASIGILGAANTGLAYSNSPYSDAQVTPASAGINYRIVGAGLRIRYIGTELNRGGTIIALVDPTSSTTIGQTPANMLGEVTSKKFVVNKIWTTILWRPVLVTDYSLTSVAPSTHFNDNDFGPLSFYVEGADNTVALKYEYEFSCVFEANGRNVRGQTVTKTDTTAQTAIAAESVTSPFFVPHQASSDASTMKFLQSVANNFGKTTSHIVAGKEAVVSAVKLGKTIFEVGKVAAEVLSIV